MGKKVRARAQMAITDSRGVPSAVAANSEPQKANGFPRAGDEPVQACSIDDPVKPCALVTSALFHLANEAKAMRMCLRLRGRVCRAAGRQTPQPFSSHEPPPLTTGRSPSLSDVQPTRWRPGISGRRWWRGLAGAREAFLPLRTPIRPGARRSLRATLCSAVRQLCPLDR